MKHITPVRVSNKLPKFPKREALSKNRLEKELKKRGFAVRLNKLLSGGTMSQVYSGKLNNQSVVVKHTANMLPLDPTELFISKEGHNLDARVLKLLEKSEIRVPKAIKHFPDITTTVMEDLNNEGFELLSNKILKGKLPLNSAENIGKNLAKLAKTSQKWKKFKTPETTLGNIYERGLELRLAYPNEQKQYLEIENWYLKNFSYWTWPDAYPKNCMVNKSGEVAFIDFGRSHYGDQRFMLPNFLAHIILYSIAGYIKNAEAKKFIELAIKAYKKIQPINEEIFCKYLGMEILHRANGKWIEGITSVEQKSKLWKFGLGIFDRKINSMRKLYGHFSLGSYVQI